LVDDPAPKLPPLGSTFLETYAPRAQNAYADIDRLMRKYAKNIEHYGNELRAAKERRSRHGEMIDVTSEVSPARATRARPKKKADGAWAAAVTDVPNFSTASREPDNNSFEPHAQFGYGACRLGSFRRHFISAAEFAASLTWRASHFQGHMKSDPSCRHRLQAATTQRPSTVWDKCLGIELASLGSGGFLAHRSSGRRP
jgi:hypothetical protein